MIKTLKQFALCCAKLKKSLSNTYGNGYCAQIWPVDGLKIVTACSDQSKQAL